MNGPRTSNERVTEYTPRVVEYTPGTNKNTCQVTQDNPRSQSTTQREKSQVSLSSALRLLSALRRSTPQRSPSAGHESLSTTRVTWYAPGQSVPTIINFISRMLSTWTCESRRSGFKFSVLAHTMSHSTQRVISSCIELLCVALKAGGLHWRNAGCVQFETGTTTQKR